MRPSLTTASLLVIPQVSFSFESIEIPRVSVTEFRELYKTNKRQTPILVENVLTEEFCENICDALVSEKRSRSSSSSLRVDLQRKKPNTPPTIYNNMDIRQAIEAIMRTSRHDDALFCFEEGLLEDLSSPDIPNLLLSSREAVFPNDDWFTHFPDWAQSTDCVILAGEGATSTLHRDPYEWMGTSLCLEGSKVWRFIEPPISPGNDINDNNSYNNEHPEVIDDLLNSYRLPSTAWDENTSLSAGWQSDESLYKIRSKDIPSAREFQNFPDKFERMRQAASDPKLLSPSFVEKDGSGSRLGGTNGVCHVTLWSTVQTAGDLLVIPPYWWHQTYGLEPSVAVASQRCSEREAKQVLQHILDTTGLHGAVDLEGILDLSNPAESVENFFDALEGSMV